MQETRGERQRPSTKWPKRTGPAQPQGESKQVKQVVGERVTEQQQALVKSKIGGLAAVQAKVIKSREGRSGCRLDGKKENDAGERDWDQKLVWHWRPCPWVSVRVCWRLP
ncbi:hypothetical protein J3459_009974 [Metarhizium acridum]|uniref:uncharacterized protein n=1 Tax=Metarhizium acridum TaxID=92637 RepID=UPI001C6B4812|nr:hypothetical protein J3459_009974 [Metarhizium acridum]KAG8424689.1 hypothetical protein J3458_001461 [Metarhizium acridum]